MKASFLINIIIYKNNQSSMDENAVMFAKYTNTTYVSSCNIFIIYLKVPF